MPAGGSRPRCRGRSGRGPRLAGGREVQDHGVAVARYLHRHGPFERSIRRSHAKIAGIVTIVIAGRRGADQGAGAEERDASEGDLDGRARFRGRGARAEREPFATLPKPSSGEEDRTRKQYARGEHPDAVGIVTDETGVLAQQAGGDLPAGSARSGAVPGDLAFGFLRFGGGGGGVRPRRGGWEGGQGQASAPGFRR